MRIEPANTFGPYSRPLTTFTDAALTAIAPDRLSLSAIAPDRLSLSASALDPTGALQLQQATLVRSLLGMLVVVGELHALRVQTLTSTAEPQLPPALGETLQHEISGLLYDRNSQQLACRISLRYDALLPMPDLQPGARSFLLEAPLPLTQLHGQMLRFDCLVDARAAWPLQMLLLSGLLHFGARARITQRSVAAPTGSQEEYIPEEAPAAAPAAADDGGPPRIGAAQWLEASVLPAITRFFWRRGWFV